MRICRLLNGSEYEKFAAQQCDLSDRIVQNIRLLHFDLIQTLQTIHVVWLQQ